MKKSLFVFAAAVTLFAACKKDDDKKNSSPSGYLTAGKWYGKTSTSYYKVTDASGTVIYNEDSTIDVTLDSCEKDNWMLFHADGTITADQGATQCDPDSSMGAANIRWRLLDNGTRIQLYNVSDSSEIFLYKLKELNANSMIMSLMDTSYTMEGYNYVVKYEAAYKH